MCHVRTNLLGCHYMHTRIYTHTCIAHSDICILTCMHAWMSNLDIGLVRELAWGRAPVHASTDDASLYSVRVLVSDPRPPT